MPLILELPNDEHRIRVLIVDDHPMARAGLRVLIEDFDDLETVGEAADGEMAVNFCRQGCPDVVLMDILMPRMEGIEATAIIRGSCPNTQVIMMTSFSDEEQVEEALKAGAIGYLMKNVSSDELANAIRRANQ